MKVKITVKTPPNQAARCINSQKDALIGFKKQKDVKEQKIVNDHEFYWILEVKDEKELGKVTHRLAMGEVLIKKFYRTLFKVIRRANTLSKKFKKGSQWLKKQIIKRLDKVSMDNQDIKAQIDSMNDEEFQGWLEITDKEVMQELLSGPLFEVEVQENGI